MAAASVFFGLSTVSTMTEQMTRNHTTLTDATPIATGIVALVYR